MRVIVATSRRKSCGLITGFGVAVAAHVIWVWCQVWDFGVVATAFGCCHVKKLILAVLRSGSRKCLYRVRAPYYHHNHLHHAAIAH
jgi:hypothetical protein